ncbi:hypothetical protein FGO68_gene13706 [Halteria grandinella]|uniref:histidine kinase n=1 Tax=Halteria grandinella TaxID=5974 RepID=A0A8J8NYZ8_HALGN|nr:hypothetical protein FGO68_gene13706 [Halteria grandinella]
MIMSLAVTFLYFSYQIYILISTKAENMSQMVTGIILSTFLIIGGFFHYKWSVKNQRIARYFAIIQTILTVVLSVELNMILQVRFDQQDGWCLIISLLALLSCITYCKAEQLIMYIALLTYNMARTYHWLPTLTRYAKFNMYLTLAYLILYIFSRTYMRLVRDRFVHKKNQEQVLNLFQNLLRAYKDGIMLTSGDEIIMFNRAVGDLFADESILEEQDLTSRLEIFSERENFISSERRTQVKVGPTHNNILRPEQGNQVMVGSDIITIEQEMTIQRRRVNKSASVQELSNQMLIDKIKQATLSAESKLNHFHQTGNLWQKIRAMGTLVRDDSRIQENERECTYLLPKGNMDKNLAVYTVPLTIGERNVVLTTIRDMSHWIELEQQRNLSKLKTVAFASAAHEFRNPLNAIQTSLALLDPKIDHQSCGRFFKVAKDCCELLVFLVRDILDFSQLEAKSIVLNFQNADTIQLIKECLAVFSHSAADKGIKLKIYESQCFWPVEIRLDPNRFKQIIINLLSNALKYTTRGYIRVSSILDTQSSRFGITIEDTGVGMTDSQLKRLFTPFTKILQNRELNREGVGLGLSISRNIAHAFGGDLEVSSEVNKGTKFTLWLPLTQVHLMEYQQFISRIPRAVEEPARPIQQNLPYISTQQRKRKIFESILPHKIESSLHIEPIRNPSDLKDLVQRNELAPNEG